VPFDRSPANTSAVDVLDHVLDKGIVIDAWVRVAVVGIDLLTVDARVVVASIETYLKHTATIGRAGALQPHYATK
jgi:gas vesicle structural protein